MKKIYGNNRHGPGGLRGIRFLFELRPIEAVEPWGAVGDRKLHWFGLTDGWQCLDTTAGRLLEYATPARPSGKTWMEYQVVRLFEDLISAWSFIAEPVPDDVASRFFGWYSRAEHARVAREGDDATQEAWDEACFWWRERNVQFDHLRWAPELHFWRAGSEVNLIWDAPGENEAGPVWSVQHARVALPLEDVREAIGSFCRDFLEAMARRVAGIERGGWKRIDCALDVAQLASEQRERETWLTAMLGRTAATDWALVRRRLDELGAR